MCPGAVATALARHMTRADFSALRRYADGHIDFSVPAIGAATQVWAAVSSDLAGAGSAYLEECANSNNAAPYAIDQHRAEQLWALSEEMCGTLHDVHSHANMHRYAPFWYG